MRRTIPWPSSQILLLVAATILLCGVQAGRAADTPTLADLKQHPEKAPAQIVLKNDVRLTITSSGKEVGAIVSPQGATVDLVSIGDTTIEIGVGAARADIPPDQTDFWQRVSPTGPAAPVATPPATVSAAPTNSLPAPPTPPPAPAAAAPPAPADNAPATSGPPIVLDDDVPPTGDVTKTAFRFWSPPYTQPIRGVIILVPGSNGDGRGTIGDPAWQDFAQKNRLALVGCCLQGGNYCAAAAGSGDALFKALRDFGSRSNHPEVEHVPLLLYGASAGGQFDYNFTLWKPDRVMAFIVNKGGGYYNSTPADSFMRAVPGLFFLGETDADYRIKAITTIWTEGRDRGALWALAPQPHSGHEFSKTAAVARVFFAAVIKNRMPDDGIAPDETARMKAMQESQGWLGDLKTHDVQDASTFSGTHDHAAWLPDQSTAEAWKVFVTGG